jgi:hypothetical protein
MSLCRIVFELWVFWFFKHSVEVHFSKIQEVRSIFCGGELRENSLNAFGVVDPSEMLKEVGGE